MRQLSTQAAAQAALTGAEPVLLAVWTLQTRAGTTVTRLASVAQGTGDFGFTLSGNLYKARFQGIPALSRSIPWQGGTAVVPTSELRLVNLDENAAWLTDTLDGLEPDAGTIDWYWVFAGGSPVDADRIRFVRAVQGQVRFSLTALTVLFSGGLLTGQPDVPRPLVTPGEYPYAGELDTNRPFPFVLGADPALLQDGGLWHSRVPFLDRSGIPMRWGLPEVGTSTTAELVTVSGDRVVFLTNVSVGGAPAQQLVFETDQGHDTARWDPNALGDSELMGTVQFTTVYDADASADLGTEGDDPRNAVTPFLDEEAVVDGDEVLVVKSLGANAQMGLFGRDDSISAFDVAYVIHHTSNSAGTASVDVQLNDGTGGAAAWNSAGSATIGPLTEPKAVGSIGNFTAGGVTLDNWDDTSRLRLVITGTTATAGVTIQAVFMWARFRPNVDELARDDSVWYGVSESYGEDSADYTNGAGVRGNDLSRVTNPVDQIETLFRHKTRGVAQTAPVLTDALAELFVPVSPSDTTLTLLGTGSDLLTNPDFSGTYTAGVAPDWTEVDSASKVAPYEATGRTNEAQGIEATNGDNPVSKGVRSTAFTVVSGSSYLVSFWAHRGSAGNVTARVTLEQTVDVDYDFTATSTWVQHTFSFVADTTSVALLLQNNDLEATKVEYDDAAVSLSLASVNDLLVFGDGSQELVSGTLNDAGFEVVRITAVSPSVTVERGVENSVAAVHYEATGLWSVVGAGGLDIAAFRAAAGLVRRRVDELMGTAGDMESFTGGVADGWTEDDPGADISLSVSTGSKYGNLAQTINGAPGNPTGVLRKAFNTAVAGDWYELGFWAKNSTDGNAVVTIEQTGVSAVQETFTLTSDYQYFSMLVQAQSIVFIVNLGVGGGTANVARYDHVQLWRLAEWSTHVALPGNETALDLRHWLDARLLPVMGASIWENEDAAVTVGAPALRADWGQAISVALTEADIAHSDPDSSGRVQQVFMDLQRSTDVYTGVYMPFAWSPQRDEYTRATFIDSEARPTGNSVASTGSVVTGAPTPVTRRTVKLADAAPTGASIVADVVIASQHGGNVSTIPSTHSVIVTGSALPTTGGVLGDWLVWQETTAINGSVFISAIESVTSRSTTSWTVVTLDTPDGVKNPRVCSWTIVSSLHTAGRMIFASVRDHGAGIGISVLPGILGGITDLDASALTGDVNLLTLFSGSDDGLGNRHQQSAYWPLNGELLSLQRLVALGRRQMLAPELRAWSVIEPETAQAAMYAAFQRGALGWSGTVRTPWTQAAMEVGDILSLTQSAIPDGAITAAVLGDGATDTLRWRKFRYREHDTGRGEHVKDT